MEKEIKRLITWQNGNNQNRTLCTVYKMGPELSDHSHYFTYREFKNIIYWTSSEKKKNDVPLYSNGIYVMIPKDSTIKMLNHTD